MCSQRVHGFREGSCVHRGLIGSERIHVFTEGSWVQRGFMCS